MASIDYDPAMRRGRLSSRERQVLAAICRVQDARPGAGHGWISGYEVFETVRSTARFGAVNHGRVFNALRVLSARDYVRVRLEQLPGGAAQRATYRLTDLGTHAFELAAHR
jgi:hypothetical protein